MITAYVNAEIQYNCIFMLIFAPVFIGILKNGTCCKVIHYLHISPFLISALYYKQFMPKFRHDKTNDIAPKIGIIYPNIFLTT